MNFGPTYAEMRDPSLLPVELRGKARQARARPLDPLNVWNIGWKAGGALTYTVLPELLTGVPSPIVVLSGRNFPTGSHKVGAAYAILAEKQLEGACRPGQHTLVFPSTGNFGIGGAWVGPRLGYRSVVVLPAEMSAERYRMIEGYGAEVVRTPGSESNVKEIYDRVREMRAEPHNRVLNQFEEFANYRFHFHCTSAAVLELARALRLEVGAFVSAMGSAGTIAAGEAIKAQHPRAVTVAAEPVQCPTLYDAGFGAHRIEGIGDKHVTWIHNVWATDLLVCVDDQECLEALQLLQQGGDTLQAEGLTAELVESWAGFFGVSGVCNVLAAIKAARYYGLRPEQGIFTVATDGFDRYPSVLQRLDEELGPMTRDDARRRLTIFTNQKLDHVLEATRTVKRRWHNQKYFTWVEQQGRAMGELRNQEDPGFWVAEQERAEAVDRAIRERRAEATA